MRTPSPTPSTPATLEPGWYTDSSQPAYLRWWNGSVWTEQRKLRASLPAARAGAIRRDRAAQRFQLR